MTIGENLKKYRKEKKLTQKEVSELLGINIRTYQKYESGDIRPTLETIDKLSEILGVPVFILTGEENHVINLFAGSNGLDNSTTSKLFWKLFEADNALNTTPEVNFVDQHKIDLCTKVMYELGYSVDVGRTTVKINDDSSVSKNIEVDIAHYLELSKNIYWALDSFIEKFIDEHSIEYIQDNNDFIRRFRENKNTSVYKPFNPPKGMHDRNKNDLNNGE